MPQIKNLSLIIKNKLFLGINENSIKFNFDENELIKFKEGDVIFKKEDSSEEFYLLISGNVKLKFPVPDGVATIENKNKNDYFGEKEFFENTPRKSSAVAETDCTIFRIKRNDYNQLISLHSEIKNNLPGQGSDNFEDSSHDTFQKKYIKRPWVIEPERNTSESEVIIHETPLDEKFFEEQVILQPDEPPEIPQQISEESPEEVPLETPIELSEEQNTNPEENLNWNFNDQNTGEEKKNNTSDPSSIDSEPEKFEWNFKERKTNEETEPQQAATQENSFFETEFLMALEALRKINSSLELASVAESIIKEIINITGAEYGRLYIFDRAANEFYGLVPGTSEKNEIRIKLNEGLTGIAAAENQIINLKNPAEDPRYVLQVDNPGDDYLRNLLCIPINNNDLITTAVIEMINSPKEIFGTNEIDILSKIAPNIAQAIENALDKTALAETKVIVQKVESKADVNVTKITNSLISDVNSPLSLIKTYSDLIKSRDISHEINPILNMITSQAELISDTLKFMSGFFSEEHSLQLEREDFNVVMNDILALLVEYIGQKKVTLYKKLSGNNFVMVDKKALYQACYQITKNACEAMPDGGEIFVVTKYSDNYVIAEFRDTGKGIHESIYENILEPFFSYDKGERAGMGLTIADKIITDHGGRILVSKTEGSGAVISIYIPIAE